MADRPDEARRGGATSTVPADEVLATLTAAGVGVYEVDLDQHRLRADARAREILGADTVAELEERIHRDDRPTVRSALTRVLTREPGYEIQFRLRDGQRWVATHGRVRRSPDGTPSELVGVVFETTPLQHDYIPAAAFLEAVPAAFFALSREWRFIYVNAAAERLLGRSRDEMLDGEIWELFPAAVGSDFEHYYRRAMTTAEPVSFDAYYPPPLDAWYEVRAEPGPHGLSVYFLDITSRHNEMARAEAAARRATLTGRLTAELVSTLDAGETVSRLAQIVVPALADWAVVSLAAIDDLGRLSGLEDVGWWHDDPQLRPLVERYARHRQEALRENSFLSRALDTGEVVSVPENTVAAIQRVLQPGPAHELIAELGPASGTVLPLRARGRTLGAISLFNNPVGAREVGYAAGR